MSKQNPLLITGGCGFVGRNLVKRLVNDNAQIWIVDDLSIGQHPDKWLPNSYKKVASFKKNIKYSNKGQNINFIFQDAIDVFKDDVLNRNLPSFSKIFHLASIVGGRELIDGDPIMVGKDLAIDSMFFYWLTRNGRDVKSVLYASSSAAYPVILQGKTKHQALKENILDFKNYVGVPDMTYGWSKLTGEYLSRLVYSRYSIPVACVRPFSGYGEDQDFSYPIPAIAKRSVLKENPFTVWGDGKQGRDFVHIDDCIDAFFVVMNQINNGEACNIGSGKLTSFLDVIKIFTDISGYNPKILRLKDKPVGVNSRYADTKLIKSFGWAPKITNEQGFQRMFDYIKNRV